MHAPPCILAVDDNEANLDILEARLVFQGYRVIKAIDGEQALAVARAQLPDLILLDVMMPKLDGISTCRALKQDLAFPYTPVVMVTARTDSEDIVRGLEAGADEYLTKPVDQAALVARVKSMLRIKALHDEVQEKNAQLEQWNRTLEARVAEQVADLEHVARLKRFFSPQLAELIISQGGEALLEGHRREVSIVFSDLRGFTAFSEVAKPKQIMAVLRAYHAAMGEEVFRFEGTIERFVGDSVMVLFNDPLPCAEHELTAVRMAFAMRGRANHLSANWTRRGYDLGVGFGIATGYATLGQIGFEDRMEYSATGPVANLASRLCDAAKHGQILISQRTYAAVEASVETQDMGQVAFKGLRNAVRTYNVVNVKTSR